MNYRALLLFLCICLLGRTFAQSSGGAGYAPAPNDPYWRVPATDLRQWHLENRWTNGLRLGIDMNAREAWATTRGEGIVIAIVDNGVDLQHRELRNQAVRDLHFNFEANQPVGDHPTSRETHGTPVAGLVVAEMNNRIGVAGMAPGARFASWVVFQTNGAFVSPAQLAKMFESHLDRVAIQNHSWVKPATRLVGMSREEDLAIEKAVTTGRNGKGVVLVRAAGNNRLNGRNANEDAYINDVRVIAVAAVDAFGRFAPYSNPGANILVSAPGGHEGDGLFTTDRTGSEEGDNRGIIFPGSDLADYVFRNLGFAGTSAATPLVSGVAALVLSANPQLSYRDVQQILLHAAIPADSNDPDALPNGAGYVVSHHTGFGALDAGRAVEYAKTWRSRPPNQRVAHSVQAFRSLPDAALTVRVSGPRVPSRLQNIRALPSLGVHPEVSTALLPLVDVGLATQPITIDLTGKGALIQRGGAPFVDKLNRAAAVGAVFAILYNNTGGDELQIMGTTERARIPAVFIGQNDGELLKQYIQQNPSGQAQIHHQPTAFTIPVPQTLICEHVQVRLRANHPRRGDLRVTLLSPSGTRSILQSLGADDAPTPTNWVYSTTHHFYEPSRGNWQVFISDQWPTSNPSPAFAEEVEVIIHGVPITDEDGDGLDDGWERTYFQNLSQGPRADPDGDGVQNAREQVLGTPPNLDSRSFVISIERWAPGYVWISWPTILNREYNLHGHLQILTPATLTGAVQGEWHRTSHVLPSDEFQQLFFRVEHH